MIVRQRLPSSPSHILSLALFRVPSTRWRNHDRCTRQFARLSSSAWLVSSSSLSFVLAHVDLPKSILNISTNKFLGKGVLSLRFDRPPADRCALWALYANEKFVCAFVACHSHFERIQHQHVGALFHFDTRKKNAICRHRIEPDRVVTFLFPAHKACIAHALSSPSHLLSGLFTLPVTQAPLARRLILVDAN